MKNNFSTILITAILTLLLTTWFFKIIYCPPCRNIEYLDHNDSLAISRAFFKGNQGCMDHNDSASVCKAFIKRDRARPGRGPRPHEGLNLMELHSGEKLFDVISPGPVPGPVFSVTPTGGTPIAIMSFTNQRSVPKIGQTPNSYSDIILPQTVTNILNAYSNDPFEEGDADYFLFDAATMFNFIYSTKGTGHVVQDLVFELGRDQNNGNRLTLIISGYDNTLNTLVPIAGSSANALENCYPCPTCGIQ